jgi:hypothetical protein
MGYDGGPEYQMIPSGAPTPAAAPAPQPAATPATDPFQDDPVGDAQSAVRRQAAERAALAAAGRSGNRQGVNPAGYRTASRPEALRYRPAHTAQLRREAGSARLVPTPAPGTYR